MFLPQVRFKRVTRQAVVWVTEALFPGYLFARFDWDHRLRQVQVARGLQNVVHFGNDWPVLSDALIDELREIVGTTELHTIIQEFVPGDAVQFNAGNLRGLQGIVSKVLPGQKRIEVLMELLGRQTGIEMAVDSLIKVGDERAELFH